MATTRAPNHIRRVAIVGVSGTIGSEITKALLAGGQHEITAISREDSKAKVPEGVNVKRVSYDNHASLTEALRGQDILIITMNPQAPPDTQLKLIDAAKDAGLQWVMPNEWGFPIASAEDEFAKDILLGVGIAKVRQYIKQAGLKSVGLACGFWYEFSLGGGEGRYGFDFEKKSLTLFDDGNTKILTSTIPSCGVAVAKLLSLPIEPNASEDGPTLSEWCDDIVYVASFYVNQHDMLDSVLRVTGDKKSDWKILHETSKERFDSGVQMMNTGDFNGFVKRLYSRAFFPDGKADFSAKVQNDKLSLPKQDLDQWTKKAVDIALNGGPSY